MLKVIMDFIKTLFMRDADPADINKPAWKKRSVVHKVLAGIGVILYFKWGLVLDNDVKDVIWDNYQVIVNSVEALVAAAMVLWGVIGSIVGQRGHVKKLEKEASAEVIRQRLDACEKKNEASTGDLPESPISHG